MLSHLVVSNSFETPMDCGPPGSFVRGILQARIPEWVAISSSRDLPNPGIKHTSSSSSVSSALACRFFNTEAPGSRLSSPVCVLCVSHSVMSDSLQPHAHSLLASSIHRTLQTRIPKGVAIPFSREPSQPRDRTWVSLIAGGSFTV